MKLPNKAITREKLQKMIKSFLSNECENSDGHLIHKKCKGGIRTGFVKLFYLDAVKLHNDPNIGSEPIKVPYCEKCNPPDGLNYTYSRIIQIKKS